MKKCIKTLFLSIILVVMSGWYHSAHASDSLSKSPENWMSKLDESKHLTEINMPGSSKIGLGKDSRQRLPYSNEVGSQVF